MFERIFKRSSEWRVEKEVVVTITINGVQRTIDGSRGLTEDLVDQLAAELKLPAEHVKSLLSQAFQGIAPRSDAVPIAAAVKGPLKRVECPKCHHMIPQKHTWCQYCGYEIPKVEETTPVRNEVDQKFLEKDVRTEETVKPTQVQQTTDPYTERLKGI